MLLAGTLLTYAVPAHADPEDTYLSVGDWQDVRVPVGIGTTVHAIPVSAYTFAPPVTVTNVTLTVDVSELTGFADVDVRDTDGIVSCDRLGDVFTCALGDAELGDESIVGLPAPELHLTTRDWQEGAGRLHMRVTGDGADTGLGDQSVSVIDGVAFGLGEMPLVTAGIGELAQIPVTVTNTGTRPIYNPRLRVSATGLKAPSKAPANCLTSDYESGMGMRLECAFPVVLEPGRTYELSAPVRLKVRRDAYAPGFTDATVGWVASGEETYLPDPRPGTGPKLTVVDAAPAPPDAPVQSVVVENEDWDGPFFIQITGDNRPNLVPTAGRLPARTGEATLTIGVGDEGPGMLPDNRGLSNVTAVWFDLPEGVVVTGFGDYCEEGAGRGENPPARYVCDVHQGFLVGRTSTFELTVRIDSVNRDATGIVLAGYGGYGDPQPHFNWDTCDDSRPIRFKR